MQTDIIQRLCHCALQAPSPDNSQPLHFAWDGQWLSCYYDQQRVGGKTFPPLDPATLLTVGASFSNLAMALESCRISAVARKLFAEAGSNPEHCYYSFNIQPEMLLSSTESEQKLMQHPLLNRHTNRGAYYLTPLPENLFSNFSPPPLSSASYQVISSTADKLSLVKLVRRASVIRFHTQQVHEWLANSIRYRGDPAQRQEGLDIDTLALPPGGAWLMRLISKWSRMRKLNLLGLGHLLAAIDSAPLAKAPTLVAVVGDNSPSGAFEAGQLLCRLWTDINAQGIAAHPYYVITDMSQRLQERKISTEFLQEAEHIQQQTNQILNLPTDQRLYMILRIGYARKPAVRSGRLPLNRVLTVADSH